MEKTELSGISIALSFIYNAIKRMELSLSEQCPNITYSRVRSVKANVNDDNTYPYSFICNEYSLVKTNLCQRFYAHAIPH